jgi:hypothetical protein
MSFGVGVGDVVLVTTLTRDLIQSARKAPQEYSEVENLALSLCLVLEDVRDITTGVQLRSNLATRLRIATIESEGILKEFNELVKKWGSLASKGRNVWARLRWPSKSMDSLRIRLITQTNMLLLLYSSVFR